MDAHSIVLAIQGALAFIFLAIVVRLIYRQHRNYPRGGMKVAYLGGGYALMFGACLEFSDTPTIAGLLLALFAIESALAWWIGNRLTT